ncbi:biotin/lipoyl-containing protein, partial [Streptomyces nanhaiensis]|uniref:biotin/lipoyl-containing protein n=1 Tax=Streptomyces nanhaiensis TaxID=679319 RepID=UPI00399C851B
MAEVREFALPDLGEGLTEAEIVRWLVSVGDVVAVDQPVVEVETAKAMVEVPCPYGGVVTARFGEEGAEVPVGAPLVTVAVGASAAAAGEPAGDGSGAPAAGSAASASGPAAGSGETAGASEKSGNVLVGYGTGAPAARRRRVRPVNGAHAPVPGPAPVSAPAVPAMPTAPAPAAPAAEPSASEGNRPADGPVPVISPPVRRLAREHGI